MLDGIGTPSVAITVEEPTQSDVLRRREDLVCVWLVLFRNHNGHAYWVEVQYPQVWQARVPVLYDDGGLNRMERGDSFQRNVRDEIETQPLESPLIKHLVPLHDKIRRRGRPREVGPS